MRSCANDSERMGWTNEQPRKALDPRKGRIGIEKLGEQAKGGHYADGGRHNDRIKGERGRFGENQFVSPSKRPVLMRVFFLS